jgi:hypothetical protein
MLDVIQSLWIGDSLSAMERLSIKSFLQNGHNVHIYTYAPVGGVPEGAVLKDANEIIHRAGVFKVRGGYSSFSDFFRWKLVLDRGGWWADLDTVCLKPFDFPDDYVFVGGLGAPGSDDCVSSGIFKAPKGSPVTQYGWDECQMMEIPKMTWGQAGPPLFTQAVHRFNLTDRIVSGKLFFPVFYTAAPEAFVSAIAPAIPGESYSIHLFNEMWRMAGKDKNRIYPETSLYEQLKRRFS